MAPRRSDDGSPDPPPDDAEALPELVVGLERRLLATLALAVLVVVGGLAWVRPDLTDPAQRENVLLALVSLLGLLAVTGLALLVPTISRIREGFQRRDAARDRLVREANAQTRRQEAYSRELERRNEDLRRFAYVVAHDLREPARTISTHAKLAERRAYGDLDEEVRENLDLAVDAAQHLDSLLGDLLAYVTIDQSVDEPEPVDLERVVDDALVRVEPTVDREDGEIVVEELPTVPGHRGPLVRLFEELVSNAVKFAPDDERPHVEIRAEAREDAWVLEVEDDGIGMDPRHADRVFSMFERLHPLQEVPGTGAGLSICRRIAELHDGDIELDGEPGEGLTVRVFLSRDPAREPHLEDADLDLVPHGEGPS